MFEINRRGIETLVAVILLIMIVGAIATLLYLWLSQYTSISMNQLQTTAVIESFQIDGYNYSANTDVLKVWIHNTGTTPIKLSMIYVAYYINNSIVDNCENDTSKLREVVINPEEVKLVIIKNCDLDGTSPTTYVIVAITTRGTVRTFTFTYTP